MNSRTIVVLVLVGTVLSFTRTLRAADTDDSEAAILFQQAKELMDQGRFAEACPKLDRSRTLDPEVGTTLNLAFCYENLGRTASAWQLWVQGAAEAAAKGQHDREVLARNRAELLEGRLLRITVLVAPQPGEDAINLVVDGVAIPKARWGAPILVDPGSHWIQATADGKLPWSTQVDVEDQHVPLVTVGILESRMVTVVSTPPAPTPQLRAEASRRTAAIVLAGVGVAALAGMTTLGLVANSTYDNPNCINNQCNAAGTDDRKRANVEATLATGAGAIGAAALAGAVTLWLVRPRSHAASLRMTPNASGSAWGVSVRGNW